MGSFGSSISLFKVAETQRSVFRDTGYTSLLVNCE